MPKASLSILQDRSATVRIENVLGANSAIRIGQLFIDILDSIALEYDNTRGYDAGRWAIWQGRLVQVIIATLPGESPATTPVKWKDFVIATAEQLDGDGENYPTLRSAAVPYINSTVNVNIGAGGTVPYADVDTPGLVRQTTDELVNAGFDKSTYISPFHLKLVRDAILGALNTVAQALNLSDEELETLTAKIAAKLGFVLGPPGEGGTPVIVTPAPTAGTDDWQATTNRGAVTTRDVKANNFSIPLRAPLNQARGLAGFNPSSASDNTLTELGYAYAAAQLDANRTPADLAGLAAQLNQYLNAGNKVIADYGVSGPGQGPEGTVAQFTATATFTDGSTGILPTGYTWDAADFFDPLTARLLPPADEIQNNTRLVTLALRYTIPGQAASVRYWPYTILDTTPVPVSTNGATLRINYNPEVSSLEVQLDPSLDGESYSLRFAAKNNTGLSGSNPDQVPLQSGIFYAPGELSGQGAFINQWRFATNMNGSGGIPPGIVLSLTIRRERDGALFTVEVQMNGLGQGVLWGRVICTATPVAATPAPTFNGSYPALPNVVEGQLYYVVLPYSAASPAAGHSIIVIEASGLPAYLQLVNSPSENQYKLVTTGSVPTPAAPATITLTWVQDDGQRVSHEYPLTITGDTAPPVSTTGDEAGEDDVQYYETGGSADTVSRAIYRRQAGNYSPPRLVNVAARTASLAPMQVAWRLDGSTAALTEADWLDMSATNTFQDTNYSATKVYGPANTSLTVYLRPASNQAAINSFTVNLPGEESTYSVATLH